MEMTSYRLGQLEALTEALDGDPEATITLCRGKPMCEADWSGEEEFVPCPFCVRLNAADPRPPKKILEEIIDAPLN